MVLNNEQQKLIEDNIKLIFDIMYSTKCPHHLFIDQYRECENALIRAAITYKSELGSFSTYAYTSIQNAIKRYRKNLKNQSICTSIQSIKNPDIIESLTIQDDKIFDQSLVDKMIKKYPEYSDIITMLSEGMNHCDIAERLGTSRQNIEKKIIIMRNYLENSKIFLTEQ